LVEQKLNSSRSGYKQATVVGFNFLRLIENTVLQLEEQSLQMRDTQATKTAVLVIGGAEDKVHGMEILHTFFVVLELQISLLLFLCLREPAMIGARYLSILKRWGEAD